MEKTIYIEREVDIDTWVEETYEVEIVDFYPARAGSYWDPPEGGEAAAGEICRVEGKNRVPVPYEVFLNLYAMQFDLSAGDAEERLVAELYEYAEEYQQGLYEDAMEAKYDAMRDDGEW